MAVFHAPLSRDGPGLLLRDIEAREREVTAVVALIGVVQPDVIALTNFDYDADGLALSAFQRLLDENGVMLPFAYAPRPNSGRPSGIDIDQDERLGEPEDAVGYGRFWGDGGVAVLSRWAIDLEKSSVDTDTLWADVPNASLPDMTDAHLLGALPVSTSAHVQAWIDHPDDPFAILTSASTAPVFDGPEDRNGYRNAAELAHWREMIADIEVPFVLAFNANLDPIDGEGHHQKMLELLASPDLIDTEPRSTGGHENADSSHAGDPALDTVDWDGPSPGNLRVSYVLPSAGWSVLEAGVFWPGREDVDAALVEAVGPHRLVWAEISLKSD
ncbi:Endonuclease/Exonuclease/phosphatase family protein [Cognatiyoonia sediminum]|uniref:Endonuclease/Exonuclease/phosphatase family protein n=1 Tax=Cognatiyoonia sediminum TaxID=1508389 RepID=A0A1M5RJK3_9RHOB|nr:Endonuclease/Exonuclease/phosphatase family protein [Cognatiyoonia sediminum]